MCGSLAERLRATAEKKGFSQAALARESGVSTGSIHEYWKGPKQPSAQNLFAIANALSVSAEWLALGREPAKTQLVDAAAADWVQVPRFDLRQLDDTTKGEVIEAVPIRRDWLNRRLLTSTGLWMAELPSDYTEFGLSEGDVVICSDVDGTPAERWVCIFRGLSGPFVARYKDRPLRESVAGESMGEVFVTAEDLQHGEIFPVARIHAKLLARL